MRANANCLPARRSGVITPGAPPVGDPYVTLRDAAVAAAIATGASMWYLGNAADLTGNVFTDSAGTVQAGVGDPIGYLKDRNANLKPSTQVTSGSKPTIVLMASGFYGMSFGGSHTLINSRGVSASNDTTNIVAYRNTGGADGPVTITSLNPTDGFPRFPAILGYKAGSVIIPGHLCVYSGGIQEFYLGGGVDATTPPVHSSVQTAGTVRQYTNGTLSATNSQPVGTNAGDDVMIRGCMGANAGDGAFFTGYLGLWCTAAVAMTTPQRTAIEAFAAYLVGQTYP